MLYQYELLTTDPDAATDFYGKVVGWQARGAGQPGMGYRLWSIGDGDVGGLGYVGVDDVEAAVEKLTAAGGAVHMRPTDIPGVGRFAFVADPQGVLF
ncbi:MAG: VOC family protein, partial [Gammaproteobacteria bacterium]